MKISSKLLATLCAAFSACYASACAAQNSFNQIYSQFLNRHFPGGNSNDGFALFVTCIIVLVLINLFFAYESHKTLKMLDSLYPDISAE